MDQLPLPSILQSNLMNASIAMSTLMPLLNSTIGNLTLLYNTTTVDPSSSNGALPTILASQSSFTQLQQQESSFSSAAASMSLLNANMATITLTRDALSAMLTTPISWEGKIQSIQATSNALQTLKTATVAVDDDLLMSMQQAQELLTGPASTLNSTLAYQTTSYMNVRPCMLSLENRMRLVNDTVMTLPSVVGEKLQILSNTEEKLDAVLGIQNSTSYQGQTASDKISSSLERAEKQLASVQQSLSTLHQVRQNVTASASRIDTAISSLNSIQSSMTASTTNLYNLLNQLDAYINNQITAPPYIVLASQTQAMGATINTQASALASWLTNAAPLYIQTQQALDYLSSNSSSSSGSISTVVSDLIIQLNSLPNTTDLLASVNQYATAYASLPTPPSLVLNDFDASLIAVVNQISSTIIDARSSLSSTIGNANSSIATLRHDSIDRIRSYEEQYLPTARHIDRIRQATLYTLFAVIFLLSLLATFSALTLWPAGLKISTFLLLIFMTITCAAVMAFTAGLKVGNDACVNLEDQIQQRISDPETLSIVRYYLYGTITIPGSNQTDNSTNAKDILKSALGIDIDATLATIAHSREQLLNGTILSYSLKPMVTNELAKAVLYSYSIARGLIIVVTMIDYRHVHPMYVAVKQYGCCTCLDMVGGVWTAMIMLVVSVFFLSVLAMMMIGVFDRRDECVRWWSRYSQDQMNNNGSGNNGRSGGYQCINETT